MIGRLNHVGVATPSIDAAVAVYRDVLGATRIGEKFALPEQGVWVCFIDVANSQIELIEPYGDASPIHGFLKKNPNGGQHHVCFEVADIIAARDTLRDRGATVLGTGEPRMGAHGVPVIFVHPKDMGGVLVELMAEPKSLIRFVAATLLIAVTAAAPAPDMTVPTTVELKTYKIKTFDYSAGRSGPLRLGYRTLGNPHKGADGQIDNAVVLLHGTGGTGAAFLGSKATILFGPGAPLDAAKNWIILPDSIGTGGSSKPSDSLGVNFPHYSYGDMVKATRALVRDELKVARVRLVVGVSMGAMLGWTWVTTYPNDVGTLVPMGAWPQAVSGRNLLWRLSARDALLANPLPGGGGARVAAGITMMANVPAPLLNRLIPDANAARDAIDARLAGALDPVDLAFQLDAIRAYDPAPKLGAISATVVALNFADDPLYPPENDPLPALARTFPRITSITVPASPKTVGHATLGEPAVWLPYVEKTMRNAR